MQYFTLPLNFKNPENESGENDFESKFITPTQVYQLSLPSETST